MFPRALLLDRDPGLLAFGGGPTEAAPFVEVAVVVAGGFLRTCLFTRPPAALKPDPAALNADWNRGSLKSDIFGTVMPYLLVGSEDL